MILNANIYKARIAYNYMQTNAINRIEIKKVLLRKYDKLKFVVIPKKSSIKAGDYVKIEKISGVKNANE